MKLVAVVVNYKTPEMTIKAARMTLKELNYVIEDWRPIIVDNDSQDGSYEKIKNLVSDYGHTDSPKWGNVEIL